MLNKVKFFGVLVIVISMLCVGTTVFGAKEMLYNKTLNLQYSEGVLSWKNIFGSNFSDIYYEVNIWLINLEYEDTHYTSNTMNIKEILDSKAKSTGSYRADVIARNGDGSIITSESVNFSYVSSMTKLEAPSNLRWDGNACKWNASPNATEYQVHLKSAIGGNLLNATTSDLEYNFSSTIPLRDGYYFTVIAMADGYRDSNSNESPTYKEPAPAEPSDETEYTIKVKMYDNDSENENLGGEISLTSGAFNGQTMFKDREITQNYQAGIPITLVARPANGYKFVCWKKGNTNLTTETTYQFNSASQDETYIAVFDKDVQESTEKEYTLTVKIYDNDSKKENVGGKISVSSGNYNGQNFFRNEEIVNDYIKGMQITFVARAEDGYVFVGWKKGNTTVSTEKMYQFKTSEKDETYTAVFTKESAEVQEPTPTPTPTSTPTSTPTEEAKEKYWSNASDWAVEELDKANEGNLIPWIFEKADLTTNITRREFAYVAVKLYEAITNIKLVEAKENPFTDTKDIEVLKAYNIGITNGTSETTFTPDALITREQMATMMTRAINKAGIDTNVDLSKVSKFADDSEMHDWGRASIYYMSNIGIIKGVGDNKFDVLGNATREQSLLISKRSAEKFVK